MIWDTIVTEIQGENSVTGVSLENTQTGEASKKEVDGVFIAIGHKPTTDLFVDQLEMDQNGYLIVEDGGGTATSVEGVFAAGDAQTGASLVVRAIAHGRNAAEAVDEFLSK